MRIIGHSYWYRNVSVFISALILSIIGSAGSVRLSAQEGSLEPNVRTEHSDGFYTTAQAIRGQVQFNRHCAYCHTVDRGPMSPDAIKSRRGFAMGDVRAVLNLGGDFLLRTTYAGQRLYPTVYYLFNRLESMPSNNVASIGQAVRADITGFLLQANGFPPGPKELPIDPQAMKAMSLDEPGFTRLFNGKNFAGMKFFLGPNCKPAPDGCGKIDPEPIFSVRDGVLVCSGQTHGYWYTEKRYLNFTLRFDYRYVPPHGWDGNDAIFSGQSGYHLFVTDHDIWPKAIEIQGRNFDTLSPIGVNAQIKATDDEDARRRARKALGQWNSVEIISNNGEVRSSLNGVLVSVVSEHEFTEPGHIAFESQGTEIHWRNIRIKVE